MAGEVRHRRGTVRHLVGHAVSGSRELVLCPLSPFYQFRTLGHEMMLPLSSVGLPPQLNLSGNIFTEHPEEGLLGDSKPYYYSSEDCMLWLLTPYSSSLQSNLR